jgi:hypothetical protein
MKIRLELEKTLFVEVKSGKMLLKSGKNAAKMLKKCHKNRKTGCNV